MRRVLSVLGVFVVVTFSTGSRCNEVTGPGPTPTPSSNSSAVPVVERVEPDIYDEGGGWLIHGRNFKPNPIATFESGGSAIRLLIVLSYPNGALLKVRSPSKPGAYAPCVTTIYGKGCGNFLVTVK